MVAHRVHAGGLARRLFVDGRAASLEEQALGQVINPDEMGCARPVTRST